MNIHQYILDSIQLAFSIEQQYMAVHDGSNNKQIRNT